jgi:hypothetical protein
VEQELLTVSEQLGSSVFSGTGKKDLIVISANGICYTDIQ